MHIKSPPCHWPHVWGCFFFLGQVHENILLMSGGNTGIQNICLLYYLYWNAWTAPSRSLSYRKGILLLVVLYYVETSFWVKQVNVIPQESPGMLGKICKVQRYIIAGKWFLAVLTICAFPHGIGFKSLFSSSIQVFFLHKMVKIIVYKDKTLLSFLYTLPHLFLIKRGGTMCTEF